MARFRNRKTDEVVAATRLKSPLQVETRDRGWLTAGAGTWHVTSTVVGQRPLVVEDPEFREDYEALDPSAERALEAPNPGELALQQSQHDAPAPPRHESRQALPPQPTARDYAAEHQAATHDISHGVDPITGEALPEPTEPVPGPDPEPEPEPEPNLHIETPPEPKPAKKAKKAKKKK